MKLVNEDAAVVAFGGRTPPGVRGLKLYRATGTDATVTVAPHPGCVD